jgi:Na+-driven multidrug efflux pump
VANLLSSCGTTIVGAVLLGIFRLGLVGAALLPACNALLLGAYAFAVLKKKKIPIPRERQAFRFDKKLYFQILKTGGLMSAQCLLCQVGEILISAQTNRFLSVEYISLLSALLPFTAVFSAFSTAVMVFVPPNYQAGSYARVKKFTRISVIASLAYALLCAALYATLGKWYYSTLFSDPVLIAKGARYWRLYALGMLPVSVLYTVRYFLDCVGENGVAAVAGIMQMLGGVITAFLFIPNLGEDGRSLSAFVGFSFAAIYCIVAYFLCRARIYKKSPQLIPPFDESI